MRAEVSVGEDEDVDAVGERLIGLTTDAVERLLESVGALGDRPGGIERARLEDQGVDLSQTFELAAAEDRLVDHELACVLGRLVEQVVLGANACRHAHHDRLACGVDRRIRDLREELLEVAVEKGSLVGQHGERQVVPHRADRLLGVARERRQDHAQVLLAVAERELSRAQRLGAWHVRRPLRQVVQARDAPVEPVAVRAARRDLALDLLVGDDPVPREVDEEELSGLEAALAQDVLGGNVQHARLGGHHDPAILRLEPAAGTQAVPVEGRTDQRAVGEGDGGWAVPRLHQATVEIVEAAEMVRNVVAAAVGLGDHHHDRVRQRAAREREQLEHVVEVGRVRAAVTDDRQHLLQIVAEELRRKLALARAHPVDVAAQRVDLAVVGDHPVRVRKLPARERVGREARVDERQRGLRARVEQVREAGPELRRHQHSLVDDRLRGEAREDQVGPGGELGDAADHVELALEGVLVGGELRRGSDDELPDDGRRLACGLADSAQVDRDVTPADDALALRHDRVGKQLLELCLAGSIVARQETDGDAVLTRRRQLVADETAKELVGHLEQDPRTVARLGVGSRRPAVLEVLERLDPPLHRLVARHAVEPRDERDTAGVVLERRIVEADRGGRAPARWIRIAAAGREYAARH